MRWAIGCAVGFVCLAGCGARRSSLLLERHARGPLAEAPEVAHRVNWLLEPMTQTQEQGQIEVTATFASPDYLGRFFSDRKIFGSFAGPNPYFPENLVFYIKIANQSDRRILVNPGEFALVDDRGNQYTPIGVDYVTAIAESRQPVSTVTRGVLEDARPGYFGLSLPVGKLFAGKPQGRFALIKQSALQAGYLHPGVVHDGLVAFWSPAKLATTIRLLVANVKTNFDANDLPNTSWEFPFTFQAIQQVATQ